MKWQCAHDARRAALADRADDEKWDGNHCRQQADTVAEAVRDLLSERLWALRQCERFGHGAHAARPTVKHFTCGRETADRGKRE